MHKEWHNISHASSPVMSAQKAVVDCQHAAASPPVLACSCLPVAAASLCQAKKPHFIKYARNRGWENSVLGIKWQGVESRQKLAEEQDK